MNKQELNVLNTVAITLERLIGTAEAEIDVSQSRRASIKLVKKPTEQDDKSDFEQNLLSEIANTKAKLEFLLDSLRIYKQGKMDGQPDQSQSNATV